MLFYDYALESFPQPEQSLEQNHWSQMCQTASLLSFVDEGLFGGSRSSAWAGMSVQAAKNAGLDKSSPDLANLVKQMGVEMNRMSGADGEHGSETELAKRKAWWGVLLADFYSVRYIISLMWVEAWQKEQWGFFLINPKPFSNISSLSPLKLQYSPSATVC